MIREAILALRLEKCGDGPAPAYFVSAGSQALGLESNAASYVACFIMKSIIRDASSYLGELPDADLDKYSLEAIVSYLEEHGYTVSSPE